MLGYLAVKDSPICQDIELVAGVEISTSHLLGGGQHSENKAQMVHVVGLAIKDQQTMQQALHTTQKERATRGRQMIHKLTQLLAIEFEPLWQATLAQTCGNRENLGRVHIAQALCQLGLVDGVQRAFDQYLADEKPAYVPLQTLTMAQAIALIHRCGGVAVLAHPTRYRLSSTRVRRLIGDFSRLGGDACELPQLDEPVSRRRMIDREILANGLLVSVGSDFHGTHTPWRKIGQVPMPTDTQVGVWQRW